MDLKRLTAWSCCQQFIGLLLARTIRQSSILKQRSVLFTIGANTRKRVFGQIIFVKRGIGLRNKTGSSSPEPRAYSLAEAANLLNFRQGTVSRGIREGNIRVVRVGSRVLLPSEGIRNILRDV